MNRLLEQPSNTSSTIELVTTSLLLVCCTVWLHGPFLPTIFFATADNVCFCKINSVNVKGFSETVYETSEGRSSFTPSVSAILFHCRQFSPYRGILRCFAKAKTRSE